MNKYFSVIVAVILLFVSLHFMRGCNKKQTQVIINETLKPQERQAVIVDTNKKEVINLRRIVDKEGKPAIIKDKTEGVRNIRVSVDPEGRVVVSATTTGFERTAGVTVGVSNALRLGVDIEYAYWKNFGAMAGISTDRQQHIALYAGVDYRLPWKFTSNTAIFVSYDTRKTVYAGLRVAL